MMGNQGCIAELQQCRVQATIPSRPEARQIDGPRHFLPSRSTALIKRENRYPPLRYKNAAQRPYRTKTAVRLTIRILLACAFSLLAVLLVVVGACGAYGIKLTDSALQSASQEVPALRALDHQLKLIARARMKLDQIANAGGQSVTNADIDAIRANLSNSDKAWATYLHFPADEDEKRIATTVGDARDDLKRNGLEPLLAALVANDQSATRALGPSMITKKYERLNEATERLALYQDDSSARLSAKGESQVRTTLTITAIVTVVGLICAFVGWKIVTVTITKPLDAAVKHFGAIERGDLTTRIVAKRQDELGTLLKSLKKMQGALYDTVQTIRGGVDRVADAAREIAAGNMDLSQRTEQQAASLEETAASMEQLSATVKENAANTAEATTLANAVSDTAREGAATVQRVLETMNSLKEGSGKIAEITAIIEGIAFQTNILALNAAVEAARAGEQGRGFAVVATEVRSLAQRSGNAAKEIKELINASVSTVLDGAAQAAEAGGQMDATLEALQRVTTVINEIASASQEQARGIQQITIAVSKMDEVTQQNAALVEQAAAASSSMDAQASRMRTVVARFQTAS